MTKCVYATIQWIDGVTENVKFAIGTWDGIEDPDVFYWLDKEENARAGFSADEWKIVGIDGWTTR